MDPGNAEFHGNFVDFDPVHSWPKPVQRPHPPIYVGGSSERTFGRVAEYGSAWLPSAIPPAELGTHIDRMRQVTGTETPVVVFGAAHDPEALDTYPELGVERVLLHLPTLPEDEALDTLAKACTRYR